MSENQTWYRYQDQLYSAGVDEFDNPLGPPTLRVDFRQYRVVKETPKGVWLDIGVFVNRSWKKKFACPTKEEALESFKARKLRQISILEARISQAERALALVEKTDVQPML